MKNIIRHGADLRPALQAHIKSCTAYLEATGLWGEDFLERLGPFAGNGKLLRGGLVCFAYEIFSGKPPPTIVIKAALSLELVHSALLIHDDVMDNDDMRRGQPALHRQYELIGHEQGLNDPRQFGVSMAICGADAALFMAFELLAQVQAETSVSTDIGRLFVVQLTCVCAGQMQDMYFDARQATPTKAAIYSLMKSKTAAYTLALPLALGAALAGEQAKLIHRLQTIGTAVGIVYQIRDDELGLFGNETTLGKPVGSDIREGKKTLLYYYLMKRANSADRQRLQQHFGNPMLADAAIAEVRKLVRRYGVQNLLLTDINRLSEQARTAIGKLPVGEQARNELLELVTFCAGRQQ